MMVELGECPLEIVSGSIALASDKVGIISVIQDSLCDPIIHYATLIEYNEQAKLFFDYLVSDKRQEGVDKTWI